MFAWWQGVLGSGEEYGEFAVCQKELGTLLHQIDDAYGQTWQVSEGSDEQPTKMLADFKH